jgi:hypothetical protein
MMRHHCGLLDPQPSPLLTRIKSQELPYLHGEALHDLRVSVLTPGFTRAWWARATGRVPKTIEKFYRTIPLELIPEAIENYHSITREDNIRLAQFWGVKPVSVKVQIKEDARNGVRWRDLQRIYRIPEQTLAGLLRSPTLSDRHLPHWFKAMIPGA